MAITVYTKPGCVQCIATIRKLEKLGLTYGTVDLSVDADAADYVKSLGHLQAPVIVAAGEHWSGYRPDRLAALSTAIAA
jgi:glutaredoxin-like protein NrdH